MILEALEASLANAQNLTAFLHTTLPSTDDRGDENDSVIAKCLAAIPIIKALNDAYLEALSLAIDLSNSLLHGTDWDTTTLEDFLDAASIHLDALVRIQVRNNYMESWQQVKTARADLAELHSFT